MSTSATSAASPLARELEQRGLVTVATPTTGGDALDRAFAARSPVIACLDVAAPSLDARHLPTLAALVRMQRAGHAPVIVLRSALALTGEPTTPCAELEPRVAAHAEAMRAQLARVLDRDPAPIFVDDRDWLGGLSYLQFLRDAGKYLSVNYLAERPSIASREELTYNELAQLLLAAFDIVEAARRHRATLCIGPAFDHDAITAALDMAARMATADDGRLVGLVATSLPVDAARTRDAAGQPVWLDAAQTTPYQFYQHWLNASDDDAAPLVRMFSPHPTPELDALLADHDRDRARRAAQRHLAQALTTWIHDERAVLGIEAANRIMFGGAALSDLSVEELELLTKLLPTYELPRDDLAAGIALGDLLARAAIAASKGAARRLITQGGVYINGAQVKDPERRVSIADLATATMLVVRSGKKTYHLIRVT
ncbi:MAG TPA: tyrosine--tRNA ligase [Kofleriaceae bacterium]|nr:tyrosine--tRNA ligase [Kofleriaceae bacterium]